MEKQALEGVKVLDFGWALVGSLTGKHLADYGAVVIRVESITRADLSRTNRLTSGSSASNPDDKPWFNHLNTSKYSLSLNLKHPEAAGIIKKLIHWADVVNENFTPGTMARLGFGYDDIISFKPDIIMVSGSLYGQSGPLAQEWGVDGTGASLSGYLDQTGWPDRGPVAPNAPYGDTVLPLFNAMAVVAALDYKRRTGKGQYIDSSMLEASIHQITPVLLDYEVNGHLTTRNGNRVAHAAPHGVFPCKGEDRWCAIAVFSHEEWIALGNVIGNPAWVKDPKFISLKARKENEDELETFLSEWTRQFSAQAVEKKMQAAGVAAGVVQTMEDILDHDPQLKEREFMLQLEHPVIGVCGHPTPAFKLSETKAQIKPAPCLGEHNDYICTQILGMPENEFIELLQQGVFE